MAHQLKSNCTLILSRDDVRRILEEALCKYSTPFSELTNLMVSADDDEDEAFLTIDFMPPSEPEATA